MGVRLICLALGYLLGNFQTAYFYGKAHGIDIRNHGSGNAGTTNALRILGKKAGIIVLLGDIMKCMLAIEIARFLFTDTYPDMIYLLSLYAAAGTVLGHNFPFYLGFKGGKGIATTAGIILFLHPAFIPVGVLLFFGTFFITHYVSLGSLLVYAGFMIELIILGQLGTFGMSQAHLNEMYIVAAFLAIMAYYKHRENIVRLIQGVERKTYLTKKNKED